MKKSDLFFLFLFCVAPFLTIVLLQWLGIDPDLAMGIGVFGPFIVFFLLHSGGGPGGGDSDWLGQGYDHDSGEGF